MFESGCGGNHRVIDDRVAEYLTGSRATKDGSPFEVSAQVAYEFTRLYQRSGAENEHRSWSFDFPRRQTRLPPVSLGPFVLCCFHEVSPSSFNRENRERCVNCFTLARNRPSPLQPHSNLDKWALALTHTRDCGNAVACQKGRRAKRENGNVGRKKNTAIRLLCQACDATFDVSKIVNGQIDRLNRKRPRNHFKRTQIGGPNGIVRIIGEARAPSAVLLRN